MTTPVSNSTTQRPAATPPPTATKAKLGDVKPKPGEVQVCRRPSELPGKDFFDKVGLGTPDHAWLRTSNWSRGMGTKDGGGGYPLVPTRANDHTKDIDKEGAHCELAVKEDPRWADLDQQCINEEFALHKDLGRWSFWHNCQTVVFDTLSKCAHQHPFDGTHALPGDFTAEMTPSWLVKAAQWVDGDTVLSGQFGDHKAPRMHPLESIGNNFYDIALRFRTTGKTFLEIFKAPSVGRVFAAIFMFLLSTIATLCRTVKTLVLDVPMHALLWVYGLGAQVVRGFKPAPMEPAPAVNV